MICLWLADAARYEQQAIARVNGWACALAKLQQAVAQQSRIDNSVTPVLANKAKRTSSSCSSRWWLVYCVVRTAVVEDTDVQANLSNTSYTRENKRTVNSLSAVGTTAVGGWLIFARATRRRRSQPKTAERRYKLTFGQGEWRRERRRQLSDPIYVNSV